MARVALHFEKKAHASRLHSLLRKITDDVLSSSDSTELLNLVREAKRVTMSVRKGENEPKSNAR